MISEDLKKLIIPNLKLHLMDEDQDKIEIMFTECYKTNPYGTPFVTLKPFDEGYGVAMQFNMLTGTYEEITDWNYIKTIGEKL